MKIVEARAGYLQALLPARIRWDRTASYYTHPDIWLHIDRNLKQHMGTFMPESALQKTRMTDNTDHLIVEVFCYSPTDWDVLSSIMEGAGLTIGPAADDKRVESGNFSTRLTIPGEKGEERDALLKFLEANVLEPYRVHCRMTGKELTQ